MQSNGRSNAKNERRSAMRSSAVLATLIVILLIFAALTTATFAWFSSNRSVTAGTTEFTANNSDSSGDVKIFWGAEENGSGLSIEMENMINMQPTTPVNAWAEGTLLSDVRYQTAIQNGTGDDATFTSVANVAMGRLLLVGNTSTASPERKEFFTIANLGSSPIGTNVRMKAAFGDLETDPNSDIIRVAVFVASSDSDYDSPSSYKYVGTLGHDNNTDTFYGNITDGALVSSQSKYQATNTVNLASGLAAGGMIHVKLLAWFDGNQLTVNRAGLTAKVTLSVEFIG